MEKEENIKKQELEYRKYLNKLLVIKNSISLICCTVLAIFFKNVWLVLLSVLFNCSIGKED